MIRKCTKAFQFTSSSYFTHQDASLEFINDYSDSSNLFFKLAKKPVQKFPAKPKKSKRKNKKLISSELEPALLTTNNDEHIGNF